MAYRENAYVPDTRTVAEKMYAKAEAKRLLTKQVNALIKSAKELRAKEIYPDVLKEIELLANISQKAVFLNNILPMDRDFCEDTVKKLLLNDGFAIDNFPNSKMCKIKWNNVSMPSKSSKGLSVSVKNTHKVKKRSWWGWKV